MGIYDYLSPSPIKSFIYLKQIGFRNSVIEKPCMLKVKKNNIKFFDKIEKILYYRKKKVVTLSQELVSEFLPSVR